MKIGIDSNKLTKIAYCIMTLSFVFIISGGVSVFLNGLQKDRMATLKRMDEVTDQFEDFSANTSVFESFRDELYSNVLSNVYYDTMYITDRNVKSQLSNYESLVDELEKNTKKLDKLCGKNYFPDSAVNNRCVNYKSIYEQVVNYFISDIKVYNSNVEKYNTYQKSNNSIFILDGYKTTKKYIDYNKDGIYDGKDE